MMETQEITKLVDGIYKNILDKFNPGARQMINAGKTYLKALHGAAAASRLYLDSVSEIAMQSQQVTWGGCTDIGTALMQIVDVYKEMQTQQMNILKAFYVDLLLPLETNLEKDTKVVQYEQKKFLQQHKQRCESYTKAAAMMKKHRKRHKNHYKSGVAMDKELKSLQLLEEERSKLDAFCEESLKTAMTQERRRYGFVLERQCSLAKHHMAYHSVGQTLYDRLENWKEVAKTREILPSTVDTTFADKLGGIKAWCMKNDEDLGPVTDIDEDDRISFTCQLRKAKSMDASSIEMRTMGTAPTPRRPLTRAKSDFHLSSSSLAQDSFDAIDNSSPKRRPTSLAVPVDNPWDAPLARALYAYLSSGENQLSFLEGDIIALLGEKNKGWQFGENLRTHCTGWFPLAYTEAIIDDSATSTSSPSIRHEDIDNSGSGGEELIEIDERGGSDCRGGGGSGRRVGGFSGSSPTMHFGQSYSYTRQNAQASRVGGVANGFKKGPPQVPPPTLPAVQRYPMSRKKHLQPPPPNASLHSSNDSGFSNDPPPAPEVDYSDDEPTSEMTIERHTKLPLIRRSGHNEDTQSNNLKMSVAHQSAKQQKMTVVDSSAKTMERGAKDLEYPYGKKLKRSKSLWKFSKKNDDNFEGMALWKHLSLIELCDDGFNTLTPKKKIGTKHSSEDGIDSESCIVVMDQCKEMETTLPRMRICSNSTLVKNKMNGSHSFLR